MYFLQITSETIFCNLTKNEKNMKLQKAFHHIYKYLETKWKGAGKCTLKYNSMPEYIPYYDINNCTAILARQQVQNVCFSKQEAKKIQC